MNKIEFIEKVSTKTGASIKEVELVFQKLIEHIIVALRDGEKVFLSNFGTFLPKITKATKRYSALLGKEIEIPEKFTVRFSPSSKLAKEINIKYAAEEPKILKPGSEREIEKKISIISPEMEKERVTEAEMGPEEISLEEEKVGLFDFEGEVSDELSIGEEILSSIDSTEKDAEKGLLEELKISEKDFTTKNEEVTKMPDKGTEKPKFTFGEDLTSGSVGSGSYTPPPNLSSMTSSDLIRREGSPALWITLVLLFLGIIGVGIYWALSTDVTQIKKEPVIERKKETAPPVVVEKRPVSPDQKKIIIAPDEFAQTPSESELKEKRGMIIEQPETEKVEEKATKSQDLTKKETTTTSKLISTVEPKKTPIKRKVVKERVASTRKAQAQGDFYIQVSSTKDEKFALSFARNLRNKGYRSFVESANVPEFGLMYRVKVGYYLNETDLEKDYHNLRLLLKREDIYVNRK